MIWKEYKTTYIAKLYPVTSLFKENMAVKLFSAQVQYVVR